MSATLGAFIKQLAARLDHRDLRDASATSAHESSNPWNNAGTGHAALCELNYTPENAGRHDRHREGREGQRAVPGVPPVLVVPRRPRGCCPTRRHFINPVPHMTFVRGRGQRRVPAPSASRRSRTTRCSPGMEFSEDPSVIATGLPLIIPGRKKAQPIAATRIAGRHRRRLRRAHPRAHRRPRDAGARLHLEQRVVNVTRERDGLWRLRVRHEVGDDTATTSAPASSSSAPAAARSACCRSPASPRSKGFGGFPISGQFLRTDDPAVVAQHQAKVYGKAAVGAPPMSVPHLDTRVVDGQASLMFGPYAGFSPKFLKTGSWFDLFASIRCAQHHPDDRGRRMPTSPS